MIRERNHTESSGKFPGAQNEQTQISSQQECAVSEQMRDFTLLAAGRHVSTNRRLGGQQGLYWVLRINSQISSIHQFKYCRHHNDNDINTL